MSVVPGRCFSAAVVFAAGCLVAASVPAQSATPRTPRLSPVSTIPVGPSPAGAATARGKVFVSVLGGNKVAVIDPVTDKRIHTVRNLSEPWDIVAAPDGSAVFVSTGADRSVVRIDARTYRRTSYPVSGGGTLAVAPNGNYLLASPGGGQVTRIGLNSGRVRTIPGSTAWSVGSFSPSGTVAYAQRVDLNPQTGVPEPVLLKVRTSDWSIRRSVNLLEDTDWSFAGDILADPAGKFVYVSKQGDNNGFTGYNGRSVQRYRSSDLRPGRVYVIDESTVSTNVELGPQGMAFPDHHWRGRLAVANSNTGRASVIDTRSRQVASRATGTGASALTWSGHKLYVANTGFGGDYPTTVSVLRSH